MNDHHDHRRSLPLKRSFVVWEPSLSRHDRSSSSVFHPSHLVLVRKRDHRAPDFILFSLGDIVIERWIPYGAQAKRRTIVQRAGAAAQYARPRNVIIQYEAAQVRIVRQFQRLGVVQANPQAYLQQYGAQLLEASALVQQARSAGVVEDIVRSPSRS